MFVHYDVLLYIYEVPFIKPTDKTLFICIEIQYVCVFIIECTCQLIYLILTKR